MTGATSHAWVPLMIVYAVKPTENGLWCIRTMSSTLADGLSLGAAIPWAFSGQAFGWDL
jgi:hypothetical protein